MNPARVTNADIDTDYSGKDRDIVKQFLLRDRLNLRTIRSAEIITFNTIAMKGAIRDVCRALYKDFDPTSWDCVVLGKKPKTELSYLQIANDICDRVENHEDEVRREYPDVFKYVDIVNGTIVSIGTHPSGVLVSDLPIDETVGLCSIGTSDYPVTMINMKELDDLMYVKLDILGLDNLGVINETCKMVGIERLTPDNTDLNDMEVWKSIRDNTTLIFQWESNSAQQYIRKFMSDETLAVAKSKSPTFSMLKWMSFGNGLLRPACASFRESVANGEFYDNGFDALNAFLAPEAGRLAMQETIMQFLVKFCGYSDAESDNVRRAIAKKKGTETLLPEIEQRFIEYSSTHYEITKERCKEVIVPFLQIILDASAYSFSWNHSDSYSAIGYICGYLRYYYPLEFLTAALNIFGDNTEKTAAITKYASKVGIRITSPKFGFSRSGYYFNKEKNVIAKGLSSVKYMSETVADELYNLSRNKRFDTFIDLLSAIDRETSLNSRQLEILIKIDFFTEFGNQRELLRLVEIYDLFVGQGGEYRKKIKKEAIDGTSLEEAVRKYSVGTTKDGKEAKSYTLTDVPAIMRELEGLVKSVGMDDLSVLVKFQNFTEIMGYSGYISGLEADRKKLYIKEVYSVARKKDGKVFGYNLLTQSIGSGKESKMTVFTRSYDKDPIKKGDIILCKNWERNGQYFNLLSYEHIYA